MADTRQGERSTSQERADTTLAELLRWQGRTDKSREGQFEGRGTTGIEPAGLTRPLAKFGRERARPTDPGNSVYRFSG
jgi:hypothetical protein